MWAKRRKYFYVTEFILLTLLHYSASYYMYIEISLSKYSVIPVAQLFYDTSAIFSKAKY